MCISILTLLSHNSSKSKISQFHILIGIKKHISRFYISMDYLFFSCVAFKQTKDYLHEDFPDYIFCNIIFFSFAAFYHFLQISTIAEFHYYEDSGLGFIDDSVVLCCFNLPVMIPNNILMFQLSQNIDFRNKLLLLFILHLPIMQFLPNQDLIIRFPFNFPNCAKTA